MGGTIPATTSVMVLAQINLQTAFGQTRLVLPASVAGTTQRLIFTWHNDASGGAQPPAVLDNIGVTSRVPSPISTGLRLVHNSTGSTASLYRNTAGASVPLHLGQRGR